MNTSFKSIVKPARVKGMSFQVTKNTFSHCLFWDRASWNMLPLKYQSNPLGPFLQQNVYKKNHCIFKSNGKEALRKKDVSYYIVTKYIPC